MFLVYSLSILAAACSRGDPPVEGDTGQEDLGDCFDAACGDWYDTSPYDVDYDGHGDDDCDDGDPAVHPGAEEVCDGVDNDCDGEVDEGFVTQWWRDADRDGYGNPDRGTVTCTPLALDVSNADDCDDDDAGTNPAATETCDGVDNNCDGTIDEGCDTASGDTGTSRR